jgi:hypothetical protein
VRFKAGGGGRLRRRSLVVRCMTQPTLRLRPPPPPDATPAVAPQSSPTAKASHSRQGAAAMSLPAPFAPMRGVQQSCSPSLTEPLTCASEAPPAAAAAPHPNIATHVLLCMMLRGRRRAARQVACAQRGLQPAPCCMAQAIANQSRPTHAVVAPGPRCWPPQRRAAPRRPRIRATSQVTTAWPKVARSLAFPHARCAYSSGLAVALLHHHIGCLTLNYIGAGLSPSGVCSRPSRPQQASNAPRPGPAPGGGGRAAPLTTAWAGAGGAAAAIGSRAA